jgi:hypothetical protein
MGVQDVRKCDDMLRILRFLSDLLEKEKITSQEHGDKAQAPTSLHELHEKLIDLEKEMKVWTACLPQSTDFMSILPHNSCWDDSFSPDVLSHCKPFLCDLTWLGICRITIIARLC